jgi:RNA polymerase sigma factor (sigma-70 family)
LKEDFLKLIEANQGIIFKVCNMYCSNQEDKEDLFQDILMNLWRSFPNYKQEAKISTWMYRIALNIAITRLRKETRRQPLEALGDEALQISSADANYLDEQSALMYQAIKQLSEIERAITMLYLENCSYKEMAEVTGLSESNIGFKLNQIKAKLKMLVKDK